MSHDQQPKHVSEPVIQALQGVQDALEGSPPDWLVELADKMEKEGRTYAEPNT